MSTISARKVHDPVSHPVDNGSVIRAASGGFTVLLLGGAVQPAVHALSAPVGVVWLVIVAVAAFAFAGWRAGAAAPVSQPMHGAAAGLLAYGLVVPIVGMAGALTVVQLTTTSLLAVGVGAGAAWLQRTVATRGGNR